MRLALLVMALFLFLGCVGQESEMSLRELRADIPETIIDRVNGSTNLYVIGVEKYRYPRIELYVDGLKVAEENQTLVLKHSLENSSSAVRVVAVTQSATYVYEGHIALEDGGVRISDATGERFVSLSRLPYEIVMEAGK